MFYILIGEGSWYALVHLESNVFDSDGRGSWFDSSFGWESKASMDGLDSVLENACGVEIPTSWKSSGFAVLLFMLSWPLYCCTVLWAALGGRWPSLKCRERLAEKNLLVACKKKIIIIFLRATQTEFVENVFTYGITCSGVLFSLYLSWCMWSLRL